ncbi:hypothetical protein ACM66B_001912 [Microbotryomycetes sp. NB124-2]
MWSPTLHWARRRMSQQQQQIVMPPPAAPDHDLINPFAAQPASSAAAAAAAARSTVMTDAIPVDPYGTTRARDRQYRSRAYSGTSEVSSNNDSILSNHWQPNTNAQAFDNEGGSVISSPATGGLNHTNSVPEARLHPSTTDQGFLCEVVGVGCSVTDRVFWPVTWHQLVQLLLEPETAAPLPAGHIVSELCQIVRARMQADPVGLHQQLGMDVAPQASATASSTLQQHSQPDASTGGSQLQHPQPVPAHSLHPYGNSQHAASELSVASFPRYEPPQLQEDTRSLNNFRMYDERPIGYAAHRERRKSAAASELQRAFTLSVTTRNQDGSPSAAHLDDMTPRTNTFQRQMYSNVVPPTATCDPSTVYPPEHFGQVRAEHGGHLVNASHLAKESENNSQAAIADYYRQDAPQEYNQAAQVAATTLDDLDLPPLPSIPAPETFIDQGRRVVKRLNPSTEHYYWDNDHQHLYPAGPGGTIPDNGELLTFPAQSYFQIFKDKNAPPLIPSDPLPRANEWIRSQVCVQECLAFRMDGKRPATIRQHFATCRFRDNLPSDPLGRLCVLQIAAGRQVKRDAKARNRTQGGAGASEDGGSRRTSSRAGSVRSFASAFDDDEDEEYVAGGERPRRRTRRSDSVRQRSMSLVSLPTLQARIRADTKWFLQTSNEGEMSIDPPSTTWPASTVTPAWSTQAHASPSFGPPATIRATHRQSQQRTSFQHLTEAEGGASFLSMEE